MKCRCMQLPSIPGTPPLCHWSLVYYTTQCFAYTSILVYYTNNHTHIPPLPITPPSICPLPTTSQHPVMKMKRIPVYGRPLTGDVHSCMGNCRTTPCISPLLGGPCLQGPFRGAPYQRHHRRVQHPPRGGRWVWCCVCM